MTEPLRRPARRAPLAANRYDRVLAEPDRLDVTGDASGHLTFGRGGHYCLDAQLARMEQQVALGTLMARPPDFGWRSAPTR